jgi:hypothetical protein
VISSTRRATDERLQLLLWHVVIYGNNVIVALTDSPIRRYINLVKFGVVLRTDYDPRHLYDVGMTCGYTQRFFFGGSQCCSGQLLYINYHCSLKILGTYTPRLSDLQYFCPKNALVSEFNSR